MELLNTLQLTTVGSVLMILYLQQVIVANQKETTLKQINTQLCIFTLISFIIATSSLIPLIETYITKEDPFGLVLVYVKLAMIPLIGLYFCRIKELTKPNILLLMFFMYLLNDFSFPLYFIHKAFDFIDMIFNNNFTAFFKNIAKLVYESLKLKNL